MSSPVGYASRSSPPEIASFLHFVTKNLQIIPPMNCLFPAFCDKKYKYLQHPAWLSCRQNIVASFLVIVMHEEPSLVKILLDHMFWKNLQSLDSFGRSSVTYLQYLDHGSCVDHVCDVMATAGDQKTMSVIT